MSLRYLPVGKSLTIAVFAGCIVCVIMACSPVLHSVKADPDCVSFEVLDTLIVDGASYIWPDAPTLEVLAIGQRDIQSSMLVPRNAEKLDVVVALSPQAAERLADATRRDADRQLRISRAGFHTR